MEIAPNFEPSPSHGETEGTQSAEEKPQDRLHIDEAANTTLESDLELYTSSSSSLEAENNQNEKPASPPVKEDPKPVIGKPQSPTENAVLCYPSLDGLTGDDRRVGSEMAPSSPAGMIPRPPENAAVPRFDFWAPNNYKRTVKRVDDGVKLCEDMLKLVSERAEIEGLYATKLQGWSRKWKDLIDKGSEYASVKTSWQSMTVEADEIAQIHMELQQKMLNQVYNSITTWKTSNYHKSLLSWKETKNAEEKFSKAQKPWAKKYDEVLKCKRAYHTACRARDQAEKLEKEMSWKNVEDTATAEQLKKLKEKTRRASADAENACVKYKESFRDITSYNPKYKEDMCYVFNGLQEFEERRKTFFKRTLQDYCSLLELSQYFDRIAKIYSSMASSFDSADVASDLSWWAVNFGTETPVHWPEFEEYSASQVEERVVTQQETPKPAEKEQRKSSPQSKQKSSVCATL